MLRVSLLLFLLLSFLPGTTHAQYWAEHHPTGPLYPFNTIDFDSDGDIDIIAVGGGVYVIENNLPDPWQEYEHDIPDLWATTSFISDFGADGDLDYAYYSGGVTYGALGWVENLGNHQYIVHEIEEFEYGGQHNTISAGDVEGDGDIDIVVTMAPDGDVHGLTTWTQQNGSTWTATQLSEFAHRGLSRLVDIDGDSFLDFTATSSWSDEDTLAGGIMVYFGTEDGLFEQHRLRWANAWACKEHQIVDFDFDGDLDIVTRHGYDWPYYYPCEIHWWENVGGREFVGHTIYSSWDSNEDGDYPIAVLDVENDGDMDIATSFFVSVGNRGYYVLVNQGDNETFLIEQISETVSAYAGDQLTAADIDGDGFTDLVDESVRWYENPYDEMAVGDNLVNSMLPSAIALYPAYPNPFNASTTLHLALPHPAEVTVSVYNVMGQHVATIADGSMPAGVHPLTFDASNLTRCLSLIHASAPNGFNQVRKVMLVR